MMSTHHLRSMPDEIRARFETKLAELFERDALMRGIDIDSAIECAVEWLREEHPQLFVSYGLSFPEGREIAMRIAATMESQ